MSRVTRSREGGAVPFSATVSLHLPVPGDDKRPEDLQGRSPSLLYSPFSVHCAVLVFPIKDDLENREQHRKK